MEGDGGRICIEMLSPEVLLHILSFLPGTQFIKCRLVCSRWKTVVDSSKKCQRLWERLTIDEFEDVYEDARNKSSKNMSWFKTYRTLRSWCMIAKATEDKRNFFPGPVKTKEVLGFQLLNRGVLGLHTKTSIDYYNLETMERCGESVCGRYVSYAEDDHYLVLLNHKKSMFVTRKELAKPNNIMEIECVRRFVLRDHKVYYTHSAYSKEYVHLIDLTDPYDKGNFISIIYDHMMSIGFVKGDFCFVNTRAEIFRLQGKHFTSVKCLDKYDNVLHELRRYDLLDRLEWRIYYLWLIDYRVRLARGILCDITCMRAYKDVYIIGCRWGIMRIYYAPYKQNLLEIFTSRPVKQFKLIEREFNRPGMSRCTVIKIDVMETPEGHTVIAALPMTIITIKFTNNFKAVRDPATYGRRRNRKHFWEEKPTPLKANAR